MKIISYIIPILIFVLVGCQNASKDPLKPNVSGRAGEVVVVMPKYLWEGETGELLRNNLADEYLVLPQPEPAFDLIYIPPNALTNTLKLARNIIIVTIGDETKITRQYNTWANTQLLVQIRGKNSKELNQLIEEKKDQLYNMIENIERSRILRSYKANQKTEISQYLSKNHNLSLVVPRNYDIDIDTNNFIWISNEDPLYTQGLFIYYYPYTDSNTFTPEYIINKRDILVRKYVPGPVDKSYMKTERNFIVDFSEYMFKNKHYVAVVRGLWKVENAFMGGPFISLTTLDEKNNRVVTVEGFVYAPEQDKRNYIRQLESIIYSLDIINEKKDKKTQ